MFERSHFKPMMFNPLTDRIVGRTWGLIRQRSTFCLLCRRPLWAVLHSLMLSILHFLCRPRRRSPSCDVSAYSEIVRLLPVLRHYNNNLVRSIDPHQYVQSLPVFSDLPLPRILNIVEHTSCVLSWLCSHPVYAQVYTSNVPWRVVLDRLSWRATCPNNHANFRLLTVARWGSCGPTRTLILLCAQSLVLWSK